MNTPFHSSCEKDYNEEHIMKCGCKHPARLFAGVKKESEKQKGINIMGNFGKKLFGMGILGAAAGAAAYYFVKKKEENPDLQEEFADFQDNVKETAASALNVASKFKEAVEKSMDTAVNKVKEYTDDFVEEDIFEDEDISDPETEDANSASQETSDLKEEVCDTAEKIKNHVCETAENVKEDVADAAEDLKEDLQDGAEAVKEDVHQVAETLKHDSSQEA